MPTQQNLLVHVGKAANLVIAELGLNKLTVLRRAGLPAGLLDGEGSRVTVEEYHRLWSSVTDEAADPLLSLKLGDASGIDYFDPAFFAAMCSPNMNIAVHRLADYKRLVSPFRLHVRKSETATDITFACVNDGPVHPTMALTEIVFLVNFLRRATRQTIVPIKVVMPFEVADASAYADHLGCPITRSDQSQVTFAATDAVRPFVTHNDEIWDLFEPKLRRFGQPRGQALTTRARVAHCLNELLPSSRATAENVARELAMSKRTLQRRLAEEGTNWLEVLSEARQTLAKHYLRNTHYGAAEVSFLLGYEDPNSFYRAFRRWENTSPETWRAAQGS